MAKYTMLVERTRTGYSALCVAEGALTTAKDMPELRANILEVLNLAVSDTGQTVTWDAVTLQAHKPFALRVLSKRK